MYPLKEWAVNFIELFNDVKNLLLKIDHARGFYVIKFKAASICLILI